MARGGAQARRGHRGERAQLAAGYRHGRGRGVPRRRRTLLRVQRRAGHDRGEPRSGQFLRRQAQEHDARLPHRAEQDRAERRLPHQLHGDDLDITRFPAPKWHEPDGGRYIGTGSFNVSRDPDEGWINCGTYRVMIHDATTAGFYISPGKHGRQMRDKYQARGEPMPFLMACSEVPYGVSEYEIVGGMRGKPVEVIRAPVTGLPIPANAEIVLEGFVAPG